MEARCKRANCFGKISDGVCEDCGRPTDGKSLLPDIAVQLPSAKVSGKSTSPSTVSGVVAGVSRPPSSSGSSSIGSGRSGSGKSGHSGSAGSHSSGMSGNILGAGLVTFPELPSMNPLLSLMNNPVVPDRKRYCNSCRSKLNHERGFCPLCGNEYSFTPTLKPGEVIAGQFEVKGAMAYGGLGWIYLGWDRTLSRWVALKGLLNSKDEASAAAALAERQFLASVKHPNIVGIYNFVTEGTEGYIVMEYVGGKTLKAIRQERGPLPVEEAIAYIHGILPAFSYLQRHGLVYCDFKPDNVMLEDSSLKLIDLGGVRREDDTQGDIYGTKGYSAPEGGENPSFSSDLYTLARSLAVLIMDFKFQGQYEFTLPTPSEQPLFAKHESLYRFLLKATHKDPSYRFQNAEAMGEQLLGILRETVALKTTVKPVESRYFLDDFMLEHYEEKDRLADDQYFYLPHLRLDLHDSAANIILVMETMPMEAKRNALGRALTQYPDSIEAPLKLANLHIETGDFTLVEQTLQAAERVDPNSWLPLWYRGKYLMAMKKWKGAQHIFFRVYDEIPGEAAPKLAIALNSEMAEEWEKAIGYYDLVSQTDSTCVTAIFGLARCQMKIGNKKETIAAYRRISPNSKLYLKAQIAIVRTLIDSKLTPLGIDELKQAGSALATIKTLTPDGLEYHQLATLLLQKAVALIATQTIKESAITYLLGRKLYLVEMQRGAEVELRSCARFAESAEQRIEFIDKANAIRPVSFV